MNARFASIAVAGAGAVGSYYGGMLARAGHRVTLIGRAAHVDAIARDGLRLESAAGVETVRVAADTELAAARGADLVLVCVKSGQTEATARALAPLLAPSAIVASLQNGVENAQTLARHVSQTVVPAVVYAAIELTAPGTVKHLGGGALVIGARDAKPDAQAALRELAALFASAGVEVTVSADVTAELWRKLAVNCAYNAVSGLTQATYRELAALPDVRALQQAAAREVIAVAEASGVSLSPDMVLAAIERIAATMPAQRSSTAQDMARRRRSEIDHLNGFVVRRGRELGVPTPVNATLYALVKLAEAGYGGGG
jgi:2-dehydropantoate 2-reductase